eukprot:Gregarina_sp_Pseudo_9__1130@NODE_173_length_3833_cov_46_265683_g159_i0_p1_GENE_NODE_173_length_3833_cov_46_265683_g159_i0NODE_173_length_3833_cov_46_265683_g159_i0_p1_ORF_typecomplete_len819_score174_42HSP90/PF00183_18/6_9e108HATPase_c_3/PF13589_6/5_6e26HATPase_c/PF02518_26/9_8e06SHOCT/PF09851_9/1_4_NODE_173_length_3833_cov_46_265683_g159_i012513707
MRILEWIIAGALCLSLTQADKSSSTTTTLAPPKSSDSEEDVDIPQVESPSLQELEEFESEDHQFMAETDRMMHIIVNSLYTDRDVFVRELISNAADALEKIRLAGLQNPKLLKGSSGDTFDEYKILIKVDKEKNEISFTDTGIGMTKEELAKNLGTIAKSGTKGFIEAAEKGVSASNLIGQFGVGFYSAFLVADKVTVISKSPIEQDQHIWVSAADGKFKVYKDKRHDKLERGTSVILTMKEDAQSYLDKWQLRKIISRFSEFVGFPIFLASIKPNDDVTDWSLINSQKPLWLRDRSEITREEYEEFYKSYFKEKSVPLGYTHFNAEGDLEFSAIMYIPSSNREFKSGMVEVEEGSKIKLYVQQVLISDSLKDFMPSWLTFVKGVIHSKDLPLKVDRETFTQSRVMRVVKNKTVNKIFELLKGLSRDAEKEAQENPERIKELFERQVDTRDRAEVMKNTEAMTAEFPKFSKYQSFWSNFGNQIVFGCMQDASREDKKKILEIFRSESSEVLAGTTLASYVKRMKPGQKKIYYLTGDDIEAMQRSPYMEKFTKHHIEVLLLAGAFEEGCLAQGEKYKDYKFQSIEKSEFDADEFAFLEAGDDSTKLKEISQQMERDWKATGLYYKPLVDWVMKAIPDTQAQYVILSKTLVDSPAMITSPSHGFTAAHEKLARTSLQGNQMMYAAFAMMKNFELNPHHPLVHKLLKQVEELVEHEKYDSAEAKALNHTIDVLYECATIASGYPPRRPHVIIQDVYNHMGSAALEHNSFELKIPSSIYSQVDAEAKTKKSKSSDTSSMDDFDDFPDEEEDDDELFEMKDEL